MLLACSEEVRCSHFGTCGGCRFQNVPYDEQLEQKELMVRELFEQTSPIIGCANPWNWRNKMEFSFSQNKAGERFLGLMMRAKRGRVVNLTECHLTNPWFIETLQNVYHWWEQSGANAYFPPANVGSLRTLTVREGIQTGERMVMLTISGDDPLDPEQIEGFKEAVGEIDSCILRTQYIARKTPTRFEQLLLTGKDHIEELLHDEEGKPYRFKIRAASFFQPNTLQAEILYQKALELIPEGRIFDLYCGTGSIGIFAAQRATEVIGIELNPEAVSDARENIALNGVTNMEILEGDVEKLLGGLPQPDCVVLDPPRAGLSKKALDQLQNYCPQKIIYISCNPNSQKRI